MSDADRNVQLRLLRAAAALDGGQVPYAVVGSNAIAAGVSRVEEAAVRNIIVPARTSTSWNDPSD